MKRRVIVEELTRNRNWNPESSTTPEEMYETVAEVIGTEKVVAGFLRALADEIDSKNSSY